MFYYIDVRFEVDADNSQIAVDVVTKELNKMIDEFEVSDEYYEKGLVGCITSTPQIIAIISADAVENMEDTEGIDADWLGTDSW